MTKPLLSRYLQDLYFIHQTGGGTEETSFYGPLENLLNAVGETLRQPVRSVFQLQDLGAGRPDFGLFAVPSGRTPRPLRITGQQPERGAGEVKGPGASLKPLLEGKQVSKYWQHYGQVLVTNLRHFAFLGKNELNQLVVLDTLELAPDEASFWNLCAHPEALSAEQADAAEQFLARCMLHGAPLDQPRELAWLLASFAREARDRLSGVDLHELDPLVTALEQSLGARFDGPKGIRFLHATIVQTLFYGVFSAWVLWHREQPDRKDEFDWRTTAHYLQIPVLQVLFEHIGASSSVDRLKMRDLMTRTGRTLRRVRREKFFNRFADSTAIQYFYEPFLEAYDPQLRKEMGVWYTPPELASYMVAKVDQMLKEKLGIEEGLADERVVVLDPCCGTGTYLVEVLRFVGRRLLQTHGALAGAMLREAATRRLFGFEILTAPFVVAHLQLGLALRAAGAPLGDGQKAAIYLTNALTGWDPAEHEKQLAILPALAQEAEQARHVKREEQIMVILGNPPYDGVSGLAISEERRLTDAYRNPTRTAQPQGQGLNDLYIRFFRIAERQIAERSGRGLVCYVSNNSWLDGLSHPGLRERLLTAFDLIYVDNLHGDKYRTGKTYNGKPDPSVFSSKANREGIQVGTAVATLVRTGATAGTEDIAYRDIRGSDKLKQLELLAAPADDLSSIGRLDVPYQRVTPVAELGLTFLPRTVRAGYLDNPTLPELFPVSFPGIKTSRDEALVDGDRAQLEMRMRAYFNPAKTDEEVTKLVPRLLESAKGFNAVQTRLTLLNHGYESGQIIPYLYRPFDLRWLYWNPHTKLLDRERADYQRNLAHGTIWLEAMQASRKAYSPSNFATVAGSLHVNERGTNFFPLFSTPQVADSEPVYNLSKLAWKYLYETGETPESLFYHALAVMHAPAYQAHNAGALQQDWPRLPLPPDPAVLAGSAVLGRKLAALLNVAAPVKGVTLGALEPELVSVAVPRHQDGGRQLDANTGHFEVKARWGYFGHKGQIMPGPGLLSTPRVAEEFRAAEWGIQTVNVHLNEDVYWANVPLGVWNYNIGGYQVLKKWLSYRSYEVMGRSLQLQEVMEFTHIARRIAALLLLYPALNANYEAMLSPIEEAVLVAV
jgi:Type ISP C-terminal specificity domain/N-6 DNA Methylase